MNVDDGIRAVLGGMSTRLPAIVTLVALLVPAASAHAARAVVPFQRGMTVGEWGPTAYEPRSTARLMRTLAARYHVDAVTLFVTWTQFQGDSSVIVPGTETAPRANLARAIRSARAAGLKVLVRPYIDPSDGTLRGAVGPDSVPRWFDSYTAFLLRYADLAQREGATGFVVGTEMVSMSKYAAAWRALVAKVRAHFKGFVTYQANWDEAERVRWWDALDAVSISAYYPLAAAAGATVPQLEHGWRRWLAAVQAIHKRSGRPVMFGEIGYRTVTTAAVEPWSIDPAPFSATAQRNAYEAALRVWYRVPWFAGLHWWYLPPQRALLAGALGADHAPSAGALDVMARWYRQRRGGPR